MCYLQRSPEGRFSQTARHVLNPAVLELIPDNQLFHITHLIDKIKENGGTNRRVPCQRKSMDRRRPVGGVPQGIKGN